MKALVQCMLKTWRMPQPRVIISVIGGAAAGSSSESEQEVMASQQQLVLRRGLLRAAHTTRAWLVTEGTANGVVPRMVGQLVQQDDEGYETVCLGLAAWDRVALHHEMEAKKTGAVYRYDHNAAAAQAAATETDVLPQQPLDANHTHFLLIDDPDGVQGSEVALRSELEKALCNYNEGSKRKSEMPTVDARRRGRRGRRSRHPRIGVPDAQAQDARRLPRRFGRRGDAPMACVGAIGAAAERGWRRRLVSQSSSAAASQSADERAIAPDLDLPSGREMRPSFKRSSTSSKNLAPSAAQLADAGNSSKRDAARARSCCASLRSAVCRRPSSTHWIT